MIWVLVAVSLKFSVDGELIVTRAYSAYDTKTRCEQMLALVKAEMAQAKPKTETVAQCVGMRKEPNA